MQINTTAQLTALINNDINLKLTDNRLETQSTFGKFMQDIGDIFRSNQTISIRNERLALAIGYRLDQNNNNHQLQLFDINHIKGNRDLRTFKHDIIFSFLNHTLNNQYGNRPQMERRNIESFIQNKINNTIDNIPINIKTIKQTINTILEENKNLIENLYLLNFEGIDENVLQTCEHAITAKLKKFFLEERTQLQEYLQGTGISRQCMADVHRNRPTITFNNHNFRIGDHLNINDQNIIEQKQNQYKNLVTRLTNNIEEQKAISFLLSQQIFSPLTNIVGSKKDYPILGTPHSINEIQDIIFRSVDNRAEQIRINLAITPDTITAEYSVPIATSIPDEMLRNRLGTISFSVSIPRSAFYEQGLVPQIQDIDQQALEHMHEQEIQMENQVAGVFRKRNFELTAHNMAVEAEQPFILNNPDVIQQQPIQEQNVQ